MKTGSDRTQKKEEPKMKKALTMVISILLTFGMTAAGAVADTETQVDTVINKLLVDSREVFSESREDLIANNGENFFVGEGNGVITATEEGLEFWVGSELYDENSIFNFVMRLDSTGDCIDQKQAIHIKFKTTTDRMEIGLWGDFGMLIEMDEKHKLYFHLPEYAYNKQYKNITIKSDQWYHLLSAVDSDGLFQGAIWKDGDEAHASYMNQAVGKSFNQPNYQRQSWEPSIQIWGEATFTIESYEYYTFTGFVEEGETVKQ